MRAGGKRRYGTLSALGTLLPLVAGIIGAHAASAAPKHRVAARPLECAAITFHGIMPGGADGIQEAGLYKSALGRLGLETRLVDHHPVNYWLTLDGHILQPIATAPPKALDPCLKAKGATIRLQQQRLPCLGERFKLVLTRTEEKADQYLLLYSLSGPAVAPSRTWRFCRAAVIAKE